MSKPVSIGDYEMQHPGSYADIDTVSEKQLISNLASQANQELAVNGFTDKAKDILQILVTLKRS
nr:MAG TPA: hypothetical protein [Caudoviricetes sp.]